MTFDITTAQPIKENESGEPQSTGRFNIMSARPTGIKEGQPTAFEEMANVNRLIAKEAVKSGSPETKGKDLTSFFEERKKNIDAPADNILAKPIKFALKGGGIDVKEEAIGKFLNAAVISGGSAIEKTFVRPITGEKFIPDDVVAEIERKHPIAQILGGTAPFLVTAPLFPEGLAGKAALMATAGQFAGIAGLSEFGRQRVEESLMTSNKDKALVVGREVVKGGIEGAIWHNADQLKFIGRPIASALARAGIKGAGTATVEAAFGANLHEAFKQGGILTALSLIFEVPHLGNTVLGRGVIANANARVADMQGVKEGHTMIKVPEDFGMKEGGSAKNLSEEFLQAKKEQIEEYRQQGRDDLVKELESDLKKIMERRMEQSSTKNPETTFKQQILDVTKTLAKDVKGAEQLNDKNKLDEKNLDKTELTQPQVKSLVEESGLKLKSIQPKGEFYSDEPAVHIDLHQPDGKSASFVIRLSELNKENLEKKVADFNKSIGEDLSPPFFTGNNHSDEYGKKIANNPQAIKKLEEHINEMKTERTRLTKEENESTEINKDREKQIASLASQVTLANDSLRVAKGTLRKGDITEKKYSPVKEEGRIGIEEKGVELNIVNEATKAKFNEEGKMDVNLIPFKAETEDLMKNSYEEFKKNVIPPQVSDPSKGTSMSLRQETGLMARRKDRFFASMAQAHKMFEKASKKSIIDTYTRAERGEKQDTLELQKIYDTTQQMLEDKAKQVQDETGRLKELIENYLPHYWEQPNKAKRFLAGIFGRRPLQGSKSFLKKRSINDFEAGIKAGLIPVSWNPIDHVMWKLTEMDRFLLAHRVLNIEKSKGTIKYVPVGVDHPQGFIKGKDPMFTVYKSPMIAVKEAFDKKMMESLETVARGLGIDVETKMKLRGGKALGLSRRGKPGGGGISDDPLMNTSHNLAKPGEIKRAFATPESVLAHEIGHQLDEMYGLKEKFLTHPSFKEELRALSDLLYEGEDASPYFKQYVRKGSEKMAHMLEAYIHAPDRFKEVAPKTFKAFEDFIVSQPELKPFTEIKPSMVTSVRKGEIYAGGNVIAGHYYGHPDVMRVIDNYLSPGLRGKFVYDLWRNANNSMIQARLSLSFFHGQFVTNDANISSFAVGLNKLSKGNVKGAFKDIVLSGLGPVAPAKIFLDGNDVNKAWYGTSDDPLANRISDLYASGGGRAKMDRFWAIEADKAISKAMKEGKYMTGVLHTPFWILQQINRPLMEYVVPRMKMGVFSQIMKMEIESNPGITNEALLEKANKAVDAVDDRLGQIVYDNLFIDRTLKDLGMASVQSLGWDIGDVRLFGGGTIDFVKNMNDFRQGKGTQLSYRLAYVLAMPIVMGWYGAIYQYLHTGKYPGQDIEGEGVGGVLKDLYFPRNGGRDKRGIESRSSLASYIKDIYHFSRDPVRTVINKLSPLPNTMIEMFQNKDYYGTEIHNEDDPLVRQFIDNVNFVVQSNLPYSVQNAQRRGTRAGMGTKVESFFGFNPAPYDIDMTEAERRAYEISKSHIKVGARTKDKAAHEQQKADLRNDFVVDEDKSKLEQAVKDKKITRLEQHTIIKESKMTNLERITQGFSIEEVVSVMKKASAGEKKELQKILDKKLKSGKSHGSLTSKQEELYDEIINNK